MLHILEILDTEAPSGNSIFLIETATSTILGGNRQANDLFAWRENVFDLPAIVKNVFTVSYIVEQAQLLLAQQDIASLDDIEVVTLKGEILKCSVDLIYATEQGEGLLLILKIKEDRRPHYLKMILDKNKRPAFLLRYGDDLLVRDGNDLFFKSFACTRDNIQEKYQNNFELFLSEEERIHYVADIYQHIQQENKGILEVPLRTARGDTLFFYFSKDAIKHLVDDEHCAFCLLVDQEETLEEIECPYDKPGQVPMKA